MSVAMAPAYPCAGGSWPDARVTQPDGAAKPRQVYLGCVFPRHRTDEKGHPVRDHESTAYVSSFKCMAEFGPCRRQEAIRRRLDQFWKHRLNQHAKRNDTPVLSA
jgi:hypothetical protein